MLSLPLAAAWDAEESRTDSREALRVFTVLLGVRAIWEGCLEDVEQAHEKLSS